MEAKLLSLAARGVLPGYKVYFIHDDPSFKKTFKTDILEGQAVSLSIEKPNWILFVVYDDGQFFWHHNISDGIEKRLFFTLHEAELALKERNNGHHSE